MAVETKTLEKYLIEVRRIAEHREAVLIARTEAHRVREVGFNDSAAQIDKKLERSDSEYRLVKTWRSMQDEAVRQGKADYIIMDGVTVQQDEYFISL